MIEYIILENTDDRVLKKASKAILDGELVVIPSDTSWLAVCHPFSKAGVDKLYALKKENKSKHFSLLCPSISEASEVARIDNSSYRVINKMVPGPYTFIFNAQLKITKALKASKTDKEIGIRIPKCPLYQSFSVIHKSPLLSTNITHEVLGIDPGVEIYGYLVEDSLSQQVKMVLDPGEVHFLGPSTIIDFTDSEAPTLVRQGSGPTNF